MRTSHRTSLVVGLATVFLWPALSLADDPGLKDLERQFRELPMEARRLTGPLFWLHGDETRARLELEVAKVAEGGNGTFTAESRPHRDWLGPDWYRDLAVCLQAARRNNLTMWIFDEKWFPSQEVAGAVPRKYASKRLTATAIDVAGPKRVESDAGGGSNFVAAVAGKVTGGGIDPNSLLDLAPYVHDGKLTMDVSPGRWKLMIFTWQPDPGPKTLVDGASQDCVDWFLRTVYQPHYDHFKDDFGKTIAGFFYDEPETHGDWGTEVPKVLAEKGVDWKPAYVAWKFQLAGDTQAAARYAYHEALSEAWGRTMYGGMTRWCHAHGVTSFGHFMEHELEYLEQDRCAGNMMQLQKYSDMGAIDAVFKQFVPGRKDDSTYQTPKLGSSISHAYGKAEGVPECWDPMRNEITRIPFVMRGEIKEFALTLEPLESVLLVFQEQARPIPHRFATDESPTGQRVPVVRDPAAKKGTDALSGQPPLGRTSGDGLTLSPVKADPFEGQAEVAGEINLARSRAVLELDDLSPEAAARVTVNGQDAGGFIGRPFRLDVTRLLRTGPNTIRIEPFAPGSAQLVINGPRRSEGR